MQQYVSALVLGFMGIIMLLMSLAPQSPYQKYRISFAQCIWVMMALLFIYMAGKSLH